MKISDLSNIELNEKIDKIISLCNYVPSKIYELNKKKIFVIYLYE